MESKSAIRARLRQQANARKANHAAQLAELHAVTEKRIAEYDYCEARSLTGVPSNANRTYRATRDSWSRGLRGKTMGAYARQPNMMGVTINGETRIVSALPERAERKVSKQATTTNVSKRTTREDHTRIIANLPAIGNVE